MPHCLSYDLFSVGIILSKNEHFLRGLNRSDHYSLDRNLSGARTRCTFFCVRCELFSEYVFGKRACKPGEVRSKCCQRIRKELCKTPRPQSWRNFGGSLSEWNISVNFCRWLATESEARLTSRSVSIYSTKQCFIWK